MTEREAFDYIEQLQKAGICPGLERVTELCRRMGNPQDQLAFVHIAGTNGKGSTLGFISTCLQEAGLRVGRYISPTIFTYRERIQVNQKPISSAKMCEGLALIKDITDQMAQEPVGLPSAFEVETALGFWYFLEKKCDVVLIETGMGGRLDATNLIKTTLLSVIASISMDHMGFLGNSLEEIAYQKAGIIKEGRPVVSACQKDEVRTVLSEEARKLDAPLHFVDLQEISHVKYGLTKQSFDYGVYKKMSITLAGQYQIENAALAVKALEILAGDERAQELFGNKLSKKGLLECLQNGLPKTQWLGRFSVVGKKPLLVVDGAHNEDAAKRLAESIAFYFTNKRIIYIMGVLKDKEYEKIISITAPLAAQIFTVMTPDNPRALPAYELARAVAQVNPNVTDTGSVEEALELAKLMAGPDGVVIAFGSLSFLGQLMTIAKDNKK